MTGAADPIVFDDGKAPGAMRTIGEVSRALGIPQHVLRYWEQQFPMLHPIKRSGRRYYRTEDVSLLVRIASMVQREGYTLRGARQAIAQSGGGSPLPIAVPTNSEVLGRVRAKLIAALADD